MLNPAIIKCPRENSSGDETTVRFTATTTSQCNAVPRVFEGEYVSVRAIGGNVWYFFTQSSTAECDRTDAAAAGGTSDATTGAYLPSGTSEQVVALNNGAVGGRVYLCRESDSDTAVLELRRA